MLIELPAIVGGDGQYMPLEGFEESDDGLCYIVGVLLFTRRSMGRKRVMRSVIVNMKSLSL